MSAQPECPECEKLTQVSEESQMIGDFLEWLTSQGIILAEYDEVLLPTWKYKGNTGINKLLAAYFDIDLDKVEAERRVLLKWLQEQQ